MDYIYTEHHGRINVLHEDDDILVLVKPHGLHTIADRVGAEAETLKSVLQNEYGDIFVVHRLDASTGGVMVFAKNTHAHRVLNMQFEQGSVSKRYTAVTVKADIMPVTVCLPISAKIAHGRYKINFKSGRDSRTTFLPVTSGRNAAVVHAIPHTGRTHQIRVHLKALKAPLWQDWIYNSRVDDRRITLFADTLEITHPVTGKYISFTSELSEFMQDVISSEV